METTRHNQSQPWSPLTIDPQFLGFIHNVDVSNLNIPSRVTFRHKRKPPSITLDTIYCKEWEVNFFRKQSLNINEHQLFRWTSANGREKRKGKLEGLPLWSPLSHWLMWSSGYSSKVPFTHTCPASSHLTSYCAGLSKIISLDYHDCEKLTTMHKVFFFNRVWHWCETGKWEFICKNFICVLLSWTNYFNLMVAC